MAIDSPDDDTKTEAVIPSRRRARRAEAELPADENPWVRRGLVLGLTLAVAGIAGFVLAGMQEGAVYAKPVDELVKEKAKFAGRPVRAEGTLVHGTLVKRDSPCEYRFTITKNGTNLPVRFAQCVVPDTFRDVEGTEVGVTVEGELKADNSFEATTVLAKCPSKYEMKDKAQKGEKMPHGPTAAGGGGSTY